MPLLEARRITFEYPGPIRALDGVDLALEPGDLTAVIGPNGSGKSTLVRLLAGLLEPASGEVLLDGRPLRAIPPRDRAQSLAVVPQYLPALPEVRVADFVASGRYARIARFAGATAADRDSVRCALAECEASDLAERSVAELSGGQRQRVLIARALAQEARVLLVDEPTSGLDPEHQLRVLELVAPLRARREAHASDAGGRTAPFAGKAALFVTHDLNLAGQFADSVVLLDRGRVVAAGSVESVLRRDVLEPVYGEHLHYGTWPSGAGAGRPYVLAHRPLAARPPLAITE